MLALELNISELSVIAGVLLSGKYNESMNFDSKIVNFFINIFVTGYLLPHLNDGWAFFHVCCRPGRDRFTMKFAGSRIEGAGIIVE